MRSLVLRRVTLAGAAGVLALPAAAPVAAPAAVPHAALPGGVDVIRPLVRLAKAPLVRRNVRVAHRLAHVRGTHLKPGYARTIRSWPIARLAHHHTVLKERLRAARRDAARSTASPALEAIAACESGGNPRTDTGNGFYGKYQFTLQTWQAVGGSGNPAQASEAEQDRRAAALYASAGAGQWPVCGR